MHTIHVVWSTIRWLHLIAGPTRDSVVNLAVVNEDWRNMVHPWLVLLGNTLLLLVAPAKNCLLDHDNYRFRALMGWCQSFLISLALEPQSHVDHSSLYEKVLLVSYILTLMPSVDFFEMSLYEWEARRAITLQRLLSFFVPQCNHISWLVNTYKSQTKIWVHMHCVCSPE